MITSILSALFLAWNIFWTILMINRFIETAKYDDHSLIDLILYGLLSLFWGIYFHFIIL